MGNYVVLMLPGRELSDKIKRYKNEILERYGYQKYVDDLPHLTLYVFSCDDINVVIDNLVELNSVDVRVDGIQVFEGDIVTGGVSVAVKFDEKSVLKLKRIQRRVVDVVNRYRDKTVLLDRYEDIEFKGLMRDNLDKYGFPFVGDIWIPHISFCSFKLKDDVDDYLSNFNIDEVKGDYKLDALGVFEIMENDDLKLVKIF